MARSKRGWLAVVGTSTLALLGWWATTVPSPAQQDDEPAPASAEPAPKPRGRLPAYFGDVVTPQQREEIYSIQAEYAPRIEELREQLRQLVAERDAQVEAVLTPEQLAEVLRLREEGRRQDAEAAAEEAAQRAIEGPATQPADDSAPPPSPARRPRRPRPQPKPE